MSFNHAMLGYLLCYRSKSRRGMTGDAVTKKGVISLDLASMAGTLKFVSGPQIPRHDKVLRERTVATTFLAHLSQLDGSTIADLNGGKNPPDVTFIYNGQLRAMELTELVPDHRYEADDIICGLRRDILSRLKAGDKTAGFVVTIFLANDYAAKIRPGRIGPILADALSAYFDRGGLDAKTVEVPEQIQDLVARISVFREDLRGDPRLEDDRHPLIVFGAQGTMLIPEEDFPAIVDSQLSQKGLQDLDCPTWLLLWSNHHSLASFRSELDNAIGFYLRSHPMKYERVFHLHLFFGSGATEFPQPSTVNDQ